MSITLEVESGTGKSNANAFITLQAAKKYFDGRKRDYTSEAFGSTTTEREEALKAAIVRATDYLSESFLWQGHRVKGRQHRDSAQALAWPRQGVTDREGHSVSDDSLPKELKHATAELAWFELTNPHKLQPVFIPHDRITTMRAGSASVEFDTARSDADGARPVLRIVRDLIGQFLAHGTRSRLVGTAVRA